MTWITFFTGLAIFAIGAGCKFLIPLAEWQALLPLVFGLGYLTIAEGMRSKPKQRKLFLFLALLWSVIVLISMIPMAREGLALWKRDAAELDQRVMRSELVMEHAGVLLVSALYLIVAMIVFFRYGPAVKPASPSSSPTAGR